MNFLNKHKNIVFPLAVILFFTILGIIIVVISRPVLTSGVVVDRIHEEAHTLRNTSYDEDGFPIVKETRYDETFYILVLGETKDGKPKTEKWKVTSFLYDRVKEGDRAFRDPETGIVSIK